MADLFSAISEFLQGVLTIINTLLVPVDTTGAVDWTALTMVQTLIWFGLVFLFVGPVFSLIIRMIKAGGGS